MTKTLPALLGAFAIATCASAQQVLVPPPTIPTAPPEISTPPAEQTVPQTGDTNEVRSAEGESTVSPAAIPHPRQPFQWGPVTLHPHLSYQFSYGTGIQSGTNQPRKTVIQSVAPGIAFSLGRHWSLDYTPSFSFYSDKNFKDTVDHSIALSGATAYQDWGLTLAQGVSISSDPQTETGTQTDQQSYSTAFGATYLVNSSVSLQMGINQNLRFTQGFENSRDWSTMEWINQQWGPNLGGGIGAGFGYVDVDTGNDMTYEQLQGRITWRVVHKISLSLNAGAEIRQFLPSGNGPTPSDLINPIFGASIFYQPFDYTTISLSAGRTVSASYFENQVTEATTLSTTVSQRLFKRYFLAVSAAYSDTSYQSSLRGFSVSRHDTYYSISTSLGTAFLKRGNASIFYSYSSNTSNSGGFAYNSDQVGFRLSYSY